MPLLGNTNRASELPQHNMSGARTATVNFGLGPMASSPTGSQASGAGSQFKKKKQNFKHGHTTVSTDALRTA